jgi:hypothetical protein
VRKVAVGVQPLGGFAVRAVVLPVGLLVDVPVLHDCFARRRCRDDKRSRELLTIK